MNCCCDYSGGWLQDHNQHSNCNSKQTPNASKSFYASPNSHALSHSSVLHRVTPKRQENEKRNELEGIIPATPHDACQQPACAISDPPPLPSHSPPAPTKRALSSTPPGLVCSPSCCASFTGETPQKKSFTRETPVTFSTPSRPRKRSRCKTPSTWIPTSPMVFWRRPPCPARKWSVLGYVCY